MKKFMIGGWFAPPPKGVLDDATRITNENYKIVADSGINLAMCICESVPKETDEVLCALKYAENNGIGIIISDLDIENNSKFDIEKWKENIKIYKDYKSFCGVVIKDEPGKTHYSLLKEKLEVFNQVLPDKIAYINLLPTYAPNPMLERGFITGDEEFVHSTFLEYDDYVESFIKTVNPKFLSYDYYGLKHDGTVLDDYFIQLEIMAEKEKKYNIPFWPMIQACKFSKNTKDPNYGEMLWQVNTSLAYGAKAIQYFTLWTPPQNTYELFDGCIIEKNGETKDKFKYIKNINDYLQKVGEYFLEARLISLNAFGSSPAPIKNFGETIKKISYVNGNAILSLLSYKNVSLLFVVCNDIKKSNDVKIVFTKEFNFILINEENFQIITSKELNIKLDCGESRIILFLEKFV